MPVANYLSLEEEVDELLKAAPDVFSAITPYGMDPSSYLKELIPRTNGYTNPPRFEARLLAANKCRYYINFLNNHPELQSFSQFGWIPDGHTEEELVELERLYKIFGKFPEMIQSYYTPLFKEVTRFSKSKPIFRDFEQPGLWNPLELLELTGGDLSFYSTVEEELNDSMFLFMQHAGISNGLSSNGEAFIGIRPYGKMKERIAPSLKNLAHGKLIGFYEIAQANVHGKKVAVIEGMQSDLMRRSKSGEYFIASPERRFYTSGKNHWLRQTLPTLEAAFKRSDAENILIATREIQLRRYNIGKLTDMLSKSNSIKELYQMPSEFGYEQQTLPVMFLRNPNILEETYWVKSLT